MTGADTYQPTLSEFPNAICFPLAYVPVCLTSPLHLFLPTSLKYIERHMGSGKAWRRPTLPQSASLLHNFIMHFVSKVRVSMSVFLIKSVIDEAKVLKMHFRKVPAPSGPCRSLLKTSVQRPHRNWQCSYDFCNRNLIVNEYKKVAEFFVHFFQPYLYVCLIYKHLYIYKHVFLLNNCTYLIWVFLWVLITFIYKLPLGPFKMMYLAFEIRTAYKTTRILPPLKRGKMTLSVQKLTNQNFS